MNISFIGLGKLGLCSAACFAAKGHSVIGVDNNTALLAALHDRKCPITETGLDTLLQSAWSHFSCTENYADAVAKSDITMIIVPTPSLADGSFSNAFVEHVLEQLAPALAAKDGFHVVDVVSTVMPGSCEQVFVPLLERLTGKRCGVDFGFAYNPEFIALGSVIHNFLHPDLVLIGASDKRTAELLQAVYASTVESAPHYGIMNLTNAEITKLSLNCFVTMKISFANELTAICEKISGADVDVVTNAMGFDSRVGRKYLTGGLGFGGPCFPRDNKAFQASANIVGYEMQLSPQVVTVNNSVPERIFLRLQEQIAPGQSVALFGVSYKQDTHITEEAQGIMLAKRLVQAGYSVRLHDPQALAEAQAELNDTVSYHISPYEAAKGVAGIALVVNWAQFAEYDWARLEQAAAPQAILVDGWRTLRNVKFINISYWPLGIGGM